MQRPELIVHLRHLDTNLRVIKSGIPEGVKVMAVVKDNAYGHGLLPVSRYLENKVDGFCVARVEEAVALREGGIQIPVLVFEIPPEGTEDLYLEYNLTAAIADLNVFERLKDETKAHLQFDTGMNRLGMKPSDVNQALVSFEEHRTRLNIEGIFTHYANADQPSDPKTEKQLRDFLEIRNRFPESLFCHTANSGATLYHADKALHLDGVRSGISLYGYSPGNDEVEGLNPVMELYAPLVQVKRISAGEAVGYGGSWQAETDGWLGIIPLGYGHGISRSLSNQIQMEIEGKPYPQKGTISMDYMTVFLGDKKMEPGSKVKVLGSGDYSAKVWADKLGTIPYEIVTGMAHFIKRRYLE